MEVKGTLVSRGGRRGIMVLIYAAIGAAIGYWLAQLGWLNYYSPRATIPAPHLIAERPGGSAFSVVMVRDVVHERFFQHSPAWHEERIRQRLAELADYDAAGDEALPAPEIEQMSAVDDISVSYDSINQPSEAIRWQLRKLQWLQPVEVAWQARVREGEVRDKSFLFDDLTQEEKALYRTYANLGTHLIHDAFGNDLMRNAEAVDQFRNGVDYIQKAIELNTDAHFGRENWQVVVASWLLAVIDDPGLLHQYDMIGNQLLTAGPPTWSPATDRWSSMWLRTNGQVAQSTEPAEIRELAVTHVGSEGNWANDVKAPAIGPSPFDQPAMGILGMWMLGGGANPHFAMTLGGIMERVGEYEIAWHAYHRALAIPNEPGREHKRFFGSDQDREQLRQYCRNRQSWIEKRLAADDDSRFNDLATNSIHETLVDEFRAVRQEASDYRAQLFQWESQQLQSGVEIESPTFYDDFYRTHGVPTTKVRSPDKVLLRPTGYYHLLNALPAMLLFGGIAAVIGMLFSRRWA